MTVTINGSGTITGVSAGGLPDGSVTDSTLALTANSQEVKDALNASGSAPIYACRAWVNFNGTGTVAIRASGNVSSITDRGTGEYTINFATAMPDANYATNGTCGTQSAIIGAFVEAPVRAAPTTTAVQCAILLHTGSLVDADYVEISVHR